MDARESAWMARYYAENRERISRQRHEKYIQDREYRARAKLRAKRYREQGQVINRKPRIKRSWAMPRIMKLGRKKFSGYFTGDVTRRTGLSKMTLRSWERKGILPKPSYISSMGWRMYTEDQINLIAATVRDCGIFPGKRTRPEKLQQLKKIVHEGWTLTLSEGIGNRRSRNGRGSGC